MSAIGLDPQNDLPGDVSLRGSIQVKEPPSESDETTTTGRQFDPHTTLLVRAPVTLEQPVMVELHLMVRLLLDGSLLEYRVTPTEQEQMWVENLQDHQFSLFLVDGGFVECNYLDGRTPDRLFVVRASIPIRPGHVHLVRAGVSANRPWLQLDHHERTGARDIEIRRTGWSGSGTVHMGGYRTIVIGRPLIAPMTKNDAILKTHETYGFSGCLLRFLVQAGTLTRAQEIDLISGDRTELAWLGVERLPSGLSEAPLCTAVQSRPTQSATQDRRLLQSDARQESPRDQMDPCSAQKQPPCHNGGLCFATGTEEYECVCQPGWQGQRCEQVVSIIPQFHGTSFIRLMGPTGKQAMQGKRLFIELGFLVTKTPGLLFLVPPSDTAGNDQFIAAYVNTEGNLVVTGRMGKSQSRLRTQPSWPPSMDSHSSLIMLQYNFTVQPHQWHTLIIDKRNKALIVRLDDRPKQRIRLILPQFRKYPKKQRQKLLAFDLSKSPIYLGGYDLQDDSATFLDIRTGMVGAIQKININGAEVILAGPPISNVPTGERLKNRNTEFWMNVSQWQGPPCGPAYSPCGMDQLKGVCRPLGPRASCACTTPLRLWHILQTQPGTSDDRAEQQACEQRQVISL
ncbi:hypothetical protein P879_10542 [Paragonimus westermani]|uniref:EGF-like domain-containing protein n=1 Tax=Paragonimus westermani TaxID=34504 RepID=A0A8T0D3Q3_9TREM|nr:hypothetical protein P879_10542 [Paragonimus westermani]